MCFFCPYDSSQWELAACDYSAPLDNQMLLFCWQARVMEKNAQKANSHMRACTSSLASVAEYYAV